MQVILLQRIGHLGQMGDIVNVKNGYARNYLLPQKKALRTTEENKKVFDSRRAQLEANNLEHRKEAEAVSAKLDKQSFVLIRSAGEMGHLYGSVSTRDIADLVVAGGFSVERNQVELKAPIKTIGLHAVAISLHPEVEATVTINIARSQDEAERQARGEEVITRDNEDIFVREVGPITDEEGYHEEA